MTATATSHHIDQLGRLRTAMEAPTGRVVVVDVPMANFLMIDGRGDAAGEDFRGALRALLELSATLRMYRQNGEGAILDPMPVEILWSPAADEVWQQALEEDWSWSAMVAQPAAVHPELVSAVRERLEPAFGRGVLRRIRLGSMREGLCAQTAYAGRVARSAEVLARLLDHVRAAGYEPHGPHHEIYVADLRHRDASPMRTVVRQPIHRLA